MSRASSGPLRGHGIGRASHPSAHESGPRAVGELRPNPAAFVESDYDRMVALEAQNHSKVVIAEMVIGAPEWMWDKYPQARHVGSDSSATYPGVGASSASG